MKQPIVIIGANDFQNQLILKANELGYETHVFAWEEGAVGKASADYYYPYSITEKALILEQCKKIKPVGIVSVASDLAVHTVNFLAEKLGLTGNSLGSTLVSTNKFEMRKRLAQSGIPTPGFILASCEEDCLELKLRFPLIVKPVDRSGSRGVEKVNDYSELKKAVSRSISFSFEKKVIIEEYIGGEEFSAEFVSFNGIHHFLAATKKFTTGAPNFIETGHMEPAVIDSSVLLRAQEEIMHALDALEIRYGASHSEFKIGEDGSIHIIEIGARMGGDCIGSDLVKISTGYDFLKMVIDISCGREPDFTRVCTPKTAVIRFILNETDLQRLDGIKQSNPGVIYGISHIEPVGTHTVIDSSSRFGYYILACDHDQALEYIKVIMEDTT